jgi:hypothetical protein
MGTAGGIRHRLVRAIGATMAVSAALGLGVGSASAAPASAPGHCAFQADSPVRHGVPHRSGHTSVGTGQGNNLVVAIPPVALIRIERGRVMVTTNTGQAPRSSDAFYVVAAGRATVAGAALRDSVLAGCTTPGTHVHS